MLHAPCTCSHHSTSGIASSLCQAAASYWIFTLLLAAGHCAYGWCGRCFTPTQAARRSWQCADPAPAGRRVAAVHGRHCTRHIISHIKERQGRKKQAANPPATASGKAVRLAACASGARACKGVRVHGTAATQTRCHQGEGGHAEGMWSVITLPHRIQAFGCGPYCSGMLCAFVCSPVN